VSAAGFNFRDMRLTLLLILLIHVPEDISAQHDSTLIQSGKRVYQSQYFDIEGSPYYFSAWVNGSVLRSDATYVENVLLNYNGFTHEIEIKSGEELYALDKRWCLRADVKVQDNPALGDELQSTVTFQQGVHRNLSGHYGAILFQGKKLTLIRDFAVAKLDKEYNEFGTNNYIAKFRDISSVYIKRGNELIQLKLNKKKIGEAFDDPDLITAFVAKEKLDLKKNADLVRLIAFADEL
jgi:hypothetical protein